MNKLIRKACLPLPILVATSFGAALANPVGMAAHDGSEASSVVVVQTAALGGGINNPIYLPDVTSVNHSGVVNLWFRNAAGVVQSACTGSLLNQRTVLTAAHCVSSNTNTLNYASFTARFRNADGSVTEVNGSGFKVQTGYSGAVREEQDVAVLTLSSNAPTGARFYSLYEGNPLQDFNIAGYGRIGTGATGSDLSSGQFGTGLNTLRAGRNRFETTGTDAGFYATSGNPNPGALGGVLRADMDMAGQASHPASFMCTTLGFCDLGLGLLEAAVGPGDSGGAAFSDSWQVLGVASWGQGFGTPGVLGNYNTSFGYACVANFSANAACLANYNFVQDNLWVPEPASLALVGLGLLGVASARRRKSA